VKQTIFITGTDTGVGKTVLTVLLTRFMHERGVHAAALKPICSGNRDDARRLFAAMDGALPLDEINPWHFRAAIAPSFAAKLQKKSVKLPQVLVQIRALQRRFDVLLVEGAGGLLSPLGENFNSHDLIAALRATPMIVAQNKIGVVNQVLLVLEALPKNLLAKARVVLAAPLKPDASTKTNAHLLAEFFDAKRIFELPHFGKNFEAGRILKISRVRRTLQALTQI
jgi:dethiobiotin synthetase